ncbi:hypothetical protein TWF481_012267 [Arthrobotrys musiformis]|uniref:Uncharacterized protein n=1 Tax=Arthrobotrys musiformis TaxID=47236 RepID=A0AAV9VYG4_9PEZI
MNLLRSSALVAAFVLSVFSQSVAAADPALPDGTYLISYKFPRSPGSWSETELWLTGGTQKTFKETGLVNVTFEDRSYRTSWEKRELQEWKVQNKYNNKVYIRNRQSGLYLGSGHKFNCGATIPDKKKAQCATSIATIGENIKVIPHSYKKDLYQLQYDSIAGGLWSPNLAPAGPIKAPEDVAVWADKWDARDVYFQIKKI